MRPVVAVVAHRHGNCPPGHDKSYTECEWRHAPETLGRTLYAFLVDENCEWPDDKREDYELTRD